MMIGKIFSILMSLILGIVSGTVYFIIANEVFYGTIPSGAPFAGMSAIAAIGLITVLVLHTVVFLLARKRFRLFAKASFISGAVCNLVVFFVLVGIKVYF